MDRERHGFVGMRLGTTMSMGTSTATAGTTTERVMPAAVGPPGLRPHGRPHVLPAGGERPDDGNRDADHHE